MKVIHNLPDLSISKNINEDAGFLITNKNGSYCNFFSTPNSKYHGLFYYHKKDSRMYKFIEDIKLFGINKDINDDIDNTDSYVKSIENNLWVVKRNIQNVTESFLMPRGFNSLVYELSRENFIDIFLDCKDSYDNREWGRHYTISKEKDCIIVKFTKKTDTREDSTNGLEEFNLYLAIKTDVMLDEDNHKENKNWVERSYLLDEQRKDYPAKRHVYNALKLNGSKFIFSMAMDENTAINEAINIFYNLKKIKDKEKKESLKLLSNNSTKKILKSNQIGKEVKVAYVNALNSLNNLVVQNYLVFAGLPWFFQSWSRDSLISLKSISKIDVMIAENLLVSYLNNIGKEGRLPNLDDFNSCSADAHGWLFLRCSYLLGIEGKSDNKINNNVRIKGNVRIKNKVKKALNKSLDNLLKYHTKNNFEINGQKETWMDTDFGNDYRSGARIEIQALRLQMYKLMFNISKNNKYKILENLLKNRVRQKFWNGKELADGLDEVMGVAKDMALEDFTVREDFTIRPNIFIASYAYQELLSSKEWDNCFDAVLKVLWLDWGGLSTIDKNNKLYTELSTGKDPKSYHRGDSWFWINNLAAIVLNSSNKKKFNRYVKKILQASTEEILWKGCIGCHAELSSAKNLESKGCYNQAWSNAMYLELVEDFAHKRRQHIFCSVSL